MLLWPTLLFLNIPIFVPPNPYTHALLRVEKNLILKSWIFTEKSYFEPSFTDFSHSPLATRIFASPQWASLIKALSQISWKTHIYFDIIFDYLS